MKLSKPGGWSGVFSNVRALSGPAAWLSATLALAATAMKVESTKKPKPEWRANGVTIAVPAQTNPPAQIYTASPGPRGGVPGSVSTNK